MNWIFEAYKIIDSFIMFNVSHLIESTSYFINTVCGLEYNNIATTNTSLENKRNDYLAQNGNVPRNLFSP